MDAITLLKDDHKTVERLFKKFEQAGDRAYVEKRDVVDRIIEELSKHAAIEEMLFYPVVRATVPETEDIALESLEEHHIVKWVLDELSGMDPTDERFDAKVTVLIENVRHHVKEEENDFFPKVRDELGRNALNDLGDSMAKAKKLAPTHPHPMAPDTPPGNLVVGLASGAVDRVGDTVSGIAQGTVSAVQDLIALILRRKKPSTSPSGSTVARKEAAKVREEVADVTDRVVEASKAAKAGTVRTARTATSAAKRTQTTAATAAKRTQSAAKGAQTTAVRGAKRTATTARSGAKRTATTAKTTARKTVAAAKG